MNNNIFRKNILKNIFKKLLKKYIKKNQKKNNIKKILKIKKINIKKIDKNNAKKVDKNNVKKIDKINVKKIQKNNNIKDNNIYIIITCCLINKDYEERKNKYIEGISQIIKLTKKIPNKKIVIVENNTTNKKTFLEKFGLDVIYTNSNNNIHTKNKGIKEMLDILTIIKKYKIKDNNLIVKITGRYILNENSNFIKTLENYNPNKTDCIIRYSHWSKQIISNKRLKYCLTGLIAMKCKNVKKIIFYKKKNNKIEYQRNSIEDSWAKETFNINLDKIRILTNLGIMVKAGNQEKYYEV